VDTFGFASDFFGAGSVATDVFVVVFGAVVFAFAKGVLDFALLVFTAGFLLFTEDFRFVVVGVTCFSADVFLIVEAASGSLAVVSASTVLEVVKVSSMGTSVVTVTLSSTFSICAASFLFWARF
jgi:hypothetical protein